MDLTDAGALPPDVAAPRLVADGNQLDQVRPLIEAQVAAFLLDRFAPLIDELAASLIARMRLRPLPLTAREREVLTLVAEGMSNGEIAHVLLITPATAKSHVENILGKLGVESRVEAAHIAFLHGLADAAATNPPKYPPLGR